MIKLFAFLGTLLTTAKALANPACTTLCPIIVGASLTLAQRMGVKDEVVGVLAGALLAIFGYWMIRFCEKHHWNFPLRNLILMLLSVGSIGFVYMGTLEYKPGLHWNLLYIDSFLLAALCGACAHILGVNLYAFLKEKNGGHAHFPFEKVVIPILFDAIVCWIFWNTSLCDCQEILILK